MDSFSTLEYLKTELHRLKQESNLLQSLIDGTSYGLVLITVDFHVVEANTMMKQWFPSVDFSSPQVCYRCFYGDTDTVCTNCPAVKSFEDGEKHTEFIESKNNTSIYKVSATPLKGPDGTVWGAIEVSEDVTERILQEKLLRDMETQCRQIIENAYDAIITFDTNGIISSLNRQAEKLFGYSKEEIVGESIAVLVPEEKQEKELESLRAAFEKPGHDYLDRIGEGICRKKDGTLVAIERGFALLKTSKGDMITAIIRDITERKKHEEAIKSYSDKLEAEVITRTGELTVSEERYRSLFNTASDAIILTNKEGIVTHFNTKAEALFGFEKNEAIGKHLKEITPAEVWHFVKQDIENHTFTQHGKVFESKGVKKDGKSFITECTISLFKRNSEINVTLILRDITERKRLERELHNHTANLEEIVRKRTSDLIVLHHNLQEKVAELSIFKEISETLSSTMELEEVLDIILVGATAHEGLGFNRAFLFLLNPEKTDIEGRSAIGPADAEDAWRIWGEITGKKLSLKEILLSYKDRAGKVDTHVNSIVKKISIPLAEENNLLVTAVKEKKTFNVTDAWSKPETPKALLEKIRCNAFAVVPLIVKNEVFGIIWADNAITGKHITQKDTDRLYAFALQAGIAIERSHLYKNLQEKVKEIEKNRDRLLNAEKLAAVGQMAATVAHGIRNPLAAIGGFARRMLKKETADTPNRKYLHIMVDEIDRLEGTLKDLLNYVKDKKLTPETADINDLIQNTIDIFEVVLQEKNVSLETDISQQISDIEVDTDEMKKVFENMVNNALEAMPEGGTLGMETAQENSWVRISISDTGVGIAKSDMSEVFNPFFSTKTRGTGLGLSECNQIVSLHGGHIKLKKNIPQGSVFEIYLPPTPPKENLA